MHAQGVEEEDARLLFVGTVVVRCLAHLIDREEHECFIGYERKTGLRTMDKKHNSSFNNNNSNTDTINNKRKTQEVSYTLSLSKNHNSSNSSGNNNNNSNTDTTNNKRKIQEVSFTLSLSRLAMQARLQCMFSTTGTNTNFFEKRSTFRVQYCTLLYAA